MIKRTGWGFALIAVILAGCIYAIYEGKFLLGIDLRGGTELVYQLDLSRVEQDETQVAEVVKATIANRLDIYGLKEISIAVQGKDRLVIQVPGLADSQEVVFIKGQIEQAGNLLFMLVAPREYQEDPARIKEYQEEEARHLAEVEAWVARKRVHDARYRAEGKEPPEFEEKRPQEPEFIVRTEVETREDPQGRTTTREKLRADGSVVQWVLHNAEQYKVKGERLTNAGSTYDENGRPAVSFNFDAQGALQFAMLTGPNVGRLLAIALDDRVRQVAEIRSKISEAGQLTGIDSGQEVRSIVNILKGGSLPTRPRIESESTVGAVLGGDSIRGGALAVVVGLASILLFLAIYYTAGGMVANLALVFNVVIILAFVVVFRQTLTFPGIAGIVLTFAMAIDANILIFERIREELAKGKSLLHSMGTGYQRAFWVIFDSNITTILTGVVLFRFGTGPVKGFAVTLIAGLVASFFTAVFVTRLIMSALYNVGILKRLHMLKIFSPPRVDYVAVRKPFVGFSVAAIALTWAIFAIPRGTDNYGIDFNGGTKITMNLNREIEVGELRRLVEGLPPPERALFKDYSIQTLNARKGERASSFTILTRTEDESGAAAAQEAGKDPAAPPAPAAKEEGPVAPAEARRQEVLKRMLDRAGLLLPDPFSPPQWQAAAGAGQRLVLDVNLTEIAPDFNQNGLSTAETMARRLNERLERHPDPRFRGEPGEASGRFKGIRIEKVEPLPPPPASQGTATIQSFRLTSTAYVEPLVGVSEAERTAPRHPEVEAEVKRWFRDQRSLRIAEPFPEVYSVGPRVAQDLQGNAIIAVFISMLGIMFYMALRFELMYGVAGIVALAHDVLITIGIMAMTDRLIGQTFSAKINLPEIAAFLTIIGFSINDTIVVFDRIREMLRNQKRKLEYKEVVNAAVNQTLSRTIWTSLTTLLVTVSLLLFGGEPIRGFSYAFAIGVVTGCYSTVFIASPVVVYLHERQLRRREALLAEAAKA